MTTTQQEGTDYQLNPHNVGVTRHASQMTLPPHLNDPHDHLNDQQFTTSITPTVTVDESWAAQGRTWG